MIASNMTNREYYALNGTLSAERIEAILDAEEFSPRIEGAISDINEAMNPFNSEDFLCATLDRILRIKKMTRSSAIADELSALYGSLEDLQQVTFYAMQYQKEKLHEALSALGE